MPVQLALDDKFQFRCHKGIACFNKCCENIDIMLTPYDILRLKNRLGITVARIHRHTTPSISRWTATACRGSSSRTKDGFGGMHQSHA